MKAQCWPQVLLLRMTDVSQEAPAAPLARAEMAELTVVIVSVTNVARTILLIASRSRQDANKREVFIGD